MRPTSDNWKHQQRVRLLPDGSIDYDHYQARARQLRSEAFMDLGYRFVAVLAITVRYATGLVRHHKKSVLGIDKSARPQRHIT